MDLRQFISEYGDILRDKVANGFTPLFNPATYRNRAFSDKLDNLLRKPFPKQKEAVLALFEGFKVHDGLFLVGEMGVGKTMMGICISYLLCKENSRTIIMCPGHLVEKWSREIQNTIHRAIVINMNKPGLSELVRLNEKPRGREFWIIGKERAKNHYSRLPAFEKLGDRFLCPSCGIELDSEPNVKRSKPVCPGCKAPLWQADKTRLRRYAKSEYVKRYLKKNTFDLFLADECHQYKAGDSAQGQAYANFLSRSAKSLSLTGTLSGGYSTNLFFLLYRLIPGKLKEICSYKNPISFAERFGVVERIEKEPVDFAGDASIGRSSSSVRIVEKPGISPLIFTELLLERCIFVGLEDVSSELPDYTEEVIEVPMEPEQETEYKAFESDLKDEVLKALSRGDKSLLGAMVNSLLAYPDGARRGEIVCHPHRIDPQTGLNEVIAIGPEIDSYYLPKEEKIIELIQDEKREGRKVMVCLEHTGTRDLIPDLLERFEKNSLSSLVLRSNTVKTDKRESWLQKKLKENDIDVFITNPRLIETGLDLLDFPTIIFFQTGYSTFTLRQSSRRSWRIGQKHNVKVFYLTYKKTMQSVALSLMADKMQVALAVEGELSNAGLTALAEGDTSIMVQMAKSLIDNGIQKSAKEAFENLEMENKKARLKINEKIVGDLIKVNRGIVKYNPQDKNAFVEVDGKFSFYFKEGLILFNEKIVGNYNKSGQGTINGKVIELYPHEDNSYILYELKEAS